MQPMFRTVHGRRLFCLRFPALTPGPALRLLVVPPFAEELNKSRRLLAETARALQRIGCEVVIPDLSGTGDSAGEFGTAEWQQWVDEVDDCAGWLAELAPSAPLACLALRSGALLLAAARAQPLAHIVLWQPVLDGARFLSQFLRLRVMASRLAGRDEPLADLERALAEDGFVEVGGYAVSAGLAAALREARATGAAFAGAGGVTVMEFKRGAELEPGAAMQRLIDEVTAAGGRATAEVVDSEQFWATQEIAAPASVVAATVAAFGLSTSPIRDT